MASTNFETDALVLDTIEHGESDQIVTFFTERNGRLTAIAKGAKRSKKRFVNKLEQFSFLKIAYQQKSTRSMAFLTEADLHTGFIQLRTDVTLYNAASLIREFLLMAVKEGEPEKKVFQLSLWALHNLNKNAPEKTIIVLYLLRFFDHIGYRPNFQECSQCYEKIHPDKKYRFDSTSGGLICSICAKTNMRNQLISHGTIKILCAGQSHPLDRLHRLKISGTILQESLRLLHNYGNQLFQREFVSWKAIQK